MSKGIPFAAGGVVARSLKMTRVTYALVGVANASIAANSVVAIGYSAFAGQMTLYGFLFASMAMVATAISADVFARSGQAVSSLRSIGASRNSISLVVTTTVLVYGAAGAILGAVLGTAIGMGIGGLATSVDTAFTALIVVTISAVATATGVYAGARLTWRN